jgi:hypothetical protein
MHAADLTEQEWRLIRDAVSCMSGGSAARDEMLTELHKKLAKLAQHPRLCLMINTGRKA